MKRVYEDSACLGTAVIYIRYLAGWWPVVVEEHPSYPPLSGTISDDGCEFKLTSRLMLSTGTVGLERGPKSREHQQVVVGNDIENFITLETCNDPRTTYVPIILMEHVYRSTY